MCIDLALSSIMSATFSMLSAIRAQSTARSGTTQKVSGRLYSGSYRVSRTKTYNLHSATTKQIMYSLPSPPSSPQGTPPTPAASFSKPDGSTKRASTPSLPSLGSVATRMARAECRNARPYFMISCSISPSPASRMPISRRRNRMPAWP